MDSDKLMTTWMSCNSAGHQFTLNISFVYENYNT